MRRAVLACLLGLILASCGGRVAASDGDSTEAETDEDTDEGESGEGTDESSTDTGEPQPCQELGPLETIDIEAIVEQETVVLDVEALATGEVMIGGYFGLLRRDESGAFEQLDAPALLSSSFMHMRRGHASEMWASAGEQLAYTPDAGESWEVWELGRGAIIHPYPPEASANGIILGGDATIATFLAGTATWSPVPALDGDTPNSSQSNMILGLAHTQGSMIAVERFGRLAITDEIDGPWTAIDGPLAFEAELLDLDEYGLLLLSSDGTLYQSDDGLAWAVHGQANSWPEVASYSTQLAMRPHDRMLFAAGSDGLQVSCDLGQSWDTIALGTESTVIYDVSIAPDGSAWAAGYNHVHRIWP